MFQFGAGVSNSSSESTNSVYNRTDFVKIESEPSISSSDYEENQSKRFQFKSEPQVFIDLTSPKSRKLCSASDRKPSLKIDLPPVKKYEWIDFGNSAQSNPIVSVPVKQIRKLKRRGITEERGSGHGESTRRRSEIRDAVVLEFGLEHLILQLKRRRLMIKLHLRCEEVKRF